MSSDVAKVKFFSCVKKFLRALKEPVIPHSLWRTFVDAANNPDTTDAETALYQVRDAFNSPSTFNMTKFKIL